MRLSSLFSFFFFNDTATTEIYTLSLHDALPIFQLRHRAALDAFVLLHRFFSYVGVETVEQDRKSTRLNSSHQIISYAVFCLKKKKTITNDYLPGIAHATATRLVYSLLRYYATLH